MPDRASGRSAGSPDARRCAVESAQNRDSSRFRSRRRIGVFRHGIQSTCRVPILMPSLPKNSSSDPADITGSGRVALGDSHVHRMSVGSGQPNRQNPVIELEMELIAVVASTPGAAHRGLEPSAVRPADDTGGTGDGTPHAPRRSYIQASAGESKGEVDSNELATRLRP